LEALEFLLQILLLNLEFFALSQDGFSRFVARSRRLVRPRLQIEQMAARLLHLELGDIFALAKGLDFSAQGLPIAV